MANKVNELLVANLSKALKCAKELDGYGLTINSIELDGRKPRILIENTKKLLKVNGTHVGVVNTADQRFERFSTDVKGTDVQWLQAI
jgi:hypothetical protein